MVRQRQRADVAHAALDVRALVARREVMQIEDAKEVVADLDEHALAEPRGLNRRRHNVPVYPCNRSTYGEARPNRATMRNVAFTRWDPLRDLLALHEQIGQLVGTDAPGWTPPVDLYETAGSVRPDRRSARARTRRASRFTPKKAASSFAASGRSGTGALRTVSSRRARPRPLLSARSCCPNRSTWTASSADLKDGLLTVTIPKAGGRSARSIDAD